MKTTILSFLLVLSFSVFGGDIDGYDSDSQDYYTCDESFDSDAEESDGEFEGDDSDPENFDGRDYQKTDQPGCSRQTLVRSWTYRGLQGVCFATGITTIATGVYCYVSSDKSEDESNFTTICEHLTNGVCKIATGFMVGHFTSMVPSILPNIAQKLGLKNRECLGGLLFVQDCFASRMFSLCMKSIGDAVGLTGAEASEVPKALQGTCPAKYDWSSPQEVVDKFCSTKMCHEECEDLVTHGVINPSVSMPTAYSVNLVFVNAEYRSKAKGPFFFGCGKHSTQVEDFEDRLVSSIGNWAKEYPESPICLWLDFKLVAKNVIENSRAHVCQRLLAKNLPTVNVHLKDLRLIPSISEQSDVFSAATPVYTRANLARIFATLHSVINSGSKYGIYSDLDIEAPLPDVLFSSDNLHRIDRFSVGLVRSYKYGWENSFFVLKEGSYELFKHALLDRCIKDLKQGIVPARIGPDFVYASHLFLFLGLANIHFPIYGEFLQGLMDDGTYDVKYLWPVIAEVLIEIGRDMHMPRKPFSCK